MSTSSEKYEAAQDEVDSLILRIQEDIALTQAATSAEEKKKLNQVSILIMMLKQETALSATNSRLQNYLQWVK